MEAGGGGPGARRTHHEQVASHHADSTDFREGVQDVIQGGGGEGVDLLGRVPRQGLLRQLERQGGVRGRRWQRPQGAALATSTPPR